MHFPYVVLEKALECPVCARGCMCVRVQGCEPTPACQEILRQLWFGWSPPPCSPGERDPVGSPENLGAGPAAAGVGALPSSAVGLSSNTGQVGISHHWAGPPGAGANGAGQPGQGGTLLSRGTHCLAIPDFSLEIEEVGIAGAWSCVVAFLTAVWQTVDTAFGGPGGVISFISHPLVFSELPVLCSSPRTWLLSTFRWQWVHLVRLVSSWWRAFFSGVS